MPPVRRQNIGRRTRNVSRLYNLRNNETEEDRSITEEEDKKTQIILDYNNYKAGVDTVDHLATNYLCIRNTRR